MRLLICAASATLPRYCFDSTCRTLPGCVRMPNRSRPLSLHQAFFRLDPPSHQRDYGLDTLQSASLACSSTSWSRAPLLLWRSSVCCSCGTIPRRSQHGSNRRQPSEPSQAGTTDRPAACSAGQLVHCLDGTRFNFDRGQAPQSPEEGDEEEVQDDGSRLSIAALEPEHEGEAQHLAASPSPTPRRMARRHGMLPPLFGDADELGCLDDLVACLGERWIDASPLAAWPEADAVCHTRSQTYSRGNIVGGCHACVCILSQAWQHGAS